MEEIYEGEEIVYYDYEIYLGTLQVQSSTHCMLPYEERHPRRRMQHFLSYICTLCNEELPLANPYDPQMQLLILGNQEDPFEREVNAVGDQFYSAEAPQVVFPNRVLMIKPNVLSGEWPLLNQPDQSKMLSDPTYREQYFSQKLDQYIAHRSIAWSKRDPRVTGLTDFINQFGKVKVWARDPDEEGAYRVNTLNVYPQLFKLYPELLPTKQCI